jgi:cellulose synthase/poly-beta-1,6-N-acetylglucosamine synthase-like glycosyltransferase
MSTSARRPEYSVIVPAYQAADVVGACVEALTQQSVARPCYEILVVDDGSPDETAAVARAAGADRVLAIPHAGPAAARNAGIEAARGAILLFTDADCIPARDWLLQMTAPFEAPGVSGVKGAYRTEQGEVVARLAQCEFEERYDLLARGETIDFVDTYAAAFRRAALEEVGTFDVAFTQANNEDVDLSYRLAKAGHRLRFNRQAVVGHRHPASWWRYVQVKARRGYWRMLVYRMHPGKALQDSYTPQTLKLQVILALLALGCVGLGLLWPALLWGALLALVGIGLSALPLVRVALRHDRAVAGWMPLFVLVRSLAFSGGVLAGAVGMLFFRPARSQQLPAHHGKV